jgi:calcineurin-like phosphoesterase family protein
MPSVFLYSDPHFGHANICKFTNYDGTPLRPWDDVNEMDEEMVRRYNEAVGPKDKTYFLGDIVINRKHLSILDRLNGDKVLIKGNHDIFRLSDYTGYFRDIRAYHVMNGCIMSHIPISKDSIARFGCNIHGHTHGNRVRKPRGVDAKTGEILYSDAIDPDYYSVCVEHTDFKPILFEEVIQRIKDQGGQIGFRQGNGPAAM